MKINLNDLYLLQGAMLKNKILKGEHVEISFTNIEALGVSVIVDLKDIVFLSNVKLINMTDFVRNQIVAQLGVSFKKHGFNQMSLFKDVERN